MKWVAICIVLILPLVIAFNDSGSSSSEIIELQASIVEQGLETIESKIIMTDRKGKSIGTQKIVSINNDSLDLELTVGGKTQLSNASLSVRVNGARSIQIESVADDYNKEKPDYIEITTPVVAMTDIQMDNASIRLPKNGDVHVILVCRNFDIGEFDCDDWEETDANFTDHGDYIEFTVEHFSAYAGGIINITKAMHLDHEKKIISDMYDLVKTHDNIWSDKIYNGEYVRVTFEQSLTPENDITILARNRRGRESYIEVYCSDTEDIVAQFPGITNEDYYTIYLGSLNDQCAMFDLKVVSDGGYLEFDHIIDPEGEINSTAIDTYGFNTGTAYTSKQLHIASNIYAVVYSGPQGAGIVSTYRANSTGQVSDIVDKHVFEPDTCGSPGIVHALGDVYAISYTGNDTDGYARTINISSNGTIGTVIGTLEYDSSYAATPAIHNITDSVFAVAYSGPGTDGYLKTFNISASGQIDQLIDNLEFDTSYAYEPKLISISANVLAIVYRGPGNDGYIKTANISSTGIIQNTVIDTVEFAASDGLSPDVTAVSGDILVIAYSGAGSDGFVSTIPVYQNGSIGSVVETYEFDPTYCYHPEIESAGNNTFVIAYRGVDSDGYLTTLEINATGHMLNTTIDIIEFDTEQCSNPNLLQLAPTVFSLAYMSTDANGYINTYEISDSGDIISGPIDKYAFAIETHTPDFIWISGSIYATVYSGQDSDGYVTTVNITDGEIISIDTFEFDTQFANDPKIINTNGNMFAIAYRGENDDGFLSTINISDKGNITKSVIQSLEFDPSDCYGPDISYVSGNVHAIAYTGVDSDGFVRTFNITVNGSISIIDTYELDTINAGNSRISQVSNEIFSLAYINGSTGMLKTINISSNGTIEAELDSYIIDSGFVDLDMNYDSLLSIAYQKQNSHGMLNTFNVSQNGTIQYLDHFIFDSYNVSNLDIMNISHDILAITYTGHGGGILRSLNISTEISSIDMLEFETTNVSYPDIGRLSDGLYAIAYRGDNNTGIMKSINISAAGIIRKNEINSFGFEAGNTIFPDIELVSGSIFVITSTGIGNEGFIRTLNISSSGQIQPTIDVFKFDDFGANTTDLIKVSEDVFAVAYTGAGFDGYIKTINVSGSGQITGLIGVLEFSNDTLDPFIIHINGSVYALAYEGEGNDGFIQTFNISNQGIKSIDTYEFDSIYGSESSVVHIYSDIYAISYKGENDDGFVLTVSIYSTGQISSTIDKQEFDLFDTQTPEIDLVYDDIYSVFYKGADGDGFVKTVEINKTGHIVTTVVDSLEFDTNDCFNPSVMKIPGNTFSVSYRGDMSDGFMTTVEIKNDGQIANSVINTSEFDAYDGYETSMINVSRSVYAVAYRSTNSNGYIKTYEITSNYLPNMTSITLSSSMIRGGDPVIITAQNVTDSDNETLEIYCSNQSIPDSSNKVTCTGGSPIDDYSPYSVSCSFATPVDDENHTTYCRIFDGVEYTNVYSGWYVTDSQTPSTTILSVAGDTAPTYYDTVNDGMTVINISGEANMSCRYGLIDQPYTAMTNNCTTIFNNSICSPAPSQGTADYYVSCKDLVGNEQNASTNNDISSLAIDWTAPTTFDNSDAAVHLPGYNVTLTEADNVDGDPTTLYCIDTSNTCNPLIATDDGAEFEFTARGASYLKYYSTDDAGNSQTIVNNTIHINVLPVFTSAFDNLTTVIGGGNITVSTFSNDSDTVLGQNLRLFVCNETGANSSGCTATTLCSDLISTENSTCSFSAPFIDAVFNWYAYIYDSSGEASVDNYKSGSVLIDSTNPVISITSPLNTTYPQNSVTAEVTINEPASFVTYSINKSSNISMTNISAILWTATVSNLTNGTFNITYYANDTVGNIGSNDVEFIIDTTFNDSLPPSITIWSPINDTFYANSSVYLNISANEGLAWAGYSVNGSAPTNMDSVSATKWNATIMLADSYHVITIIANDSSFNNNQAKKNVYIYVDTQVPVHNNSYNLPLQANNSANVTCYSEWTDAHLASAYVETNVSGAKTNSTEIVLNSSYEVISYEVDPGAVKFYCKFYIYDHAGLYNTSTVFINATDVIPPTYNYSGTYPNTTLDLDPGTVINVTIYSAADETNLDSVVLYYRQNASTNWSTALMSQTITGHNASFLASVADTWQYIVSINDTAGNEQNTSIMSLDVQYDQTWETNTTIPYIKSITQADDRDINLGNITINNTGDYTLNFTVNSSDNWIFINNSDTYSIALSPGGSVTVNGSANATNYSVGMYDYEITIYADNITGDKPQTVSARLDNKVLIQTQIDPYFYLEILSYFSSAASDTTGHILMAEIDNVGTADATETEIGWLLPTDWIVTGGSVTRDIGDLAIGASATISTSVTVGDAGTKTITAVATCDENCDESESRTVTITGDTPSTPTTPSSGSTGGSSSGGPSTSGGGSISYRDSVIAGQEFFNTEESFELVRGQTESFEINITNVYENLTLYNVTIEVEGYLAQYLDMQPLLIDVIEPDQTKSFTIRVSSPTYMEQGTYSLDFTFTGLLLGKLKKGYFTTSIEKELIEKRSVTLYILESTAEDIMLRIEEATNYLLLMQDAGFNTQRTDKLLNEAKNFFDMRDFNKVIEITDRIIGIHDSAFEADTQIRLLRQNTEESLRNGINVDEIQNMLALAEAAFLREDYETAIKRVNEAQLSLLIISGKWNAIRFMKNYWWHLSILITVLSVCGVLLKRKAELVIISKRLEDLDNEEDSINELMYEMQKKAYENKSLSVHEYDQQKSIYEKRLSEIRKTRDRMRSRKFKMNRIGDDIERLRAEDQQVIKRIKLLQDCFYRNHSISEKQYKQRMSEYKLRRLELEKSLSILVTKHAKHDRKKT